MMEFGLPTLFVGDFNESDGGRAIAFLAERGFRSALPEFAPGQTTWRWNTSLGTCNDFACSHRWCTHLQHWVVTRRCGK